MKQIELNLKKRLLIVEENKVDLNTLESLESSFIALSKGSVKLICKGSELTEEIADELVDIFDLGYFVDYNHHNPRSYKFTALESFISAIQAQGYYWGENPLGKKPELTDNQYDKEREFIENNPDELVFGDHYADWSMWNEAESKTFNPEKTLIFEILL